jgi:hypothetical protein
MDYSHIMHRFPAFELSYETFAHKKVPPIYDIAMAIPAGKKHLIWFTYDNDTDIAILLDLNKSNQIIGSRRVNVPALTTESYYGTLLYGTIIQDDELPVFVIEDLCHYRGRNVRHLLFGEKLTYLQKLFEKDLPDQCAHDGLILSLPYMRVSRDAALDSLPFYESMTKPAKYVSHHIQFRSSGKVAPYLNHIYKKPQPVVELSTQILVPRKDVNHRLPAYSRAVVFRVVADVRDDVYHMFAHGGQDTTVYVNVLYIGTRQQSKYMNSLFRNIKENINIDYGEESDDEETFQDMRLDKYVDLTREHNVECVFNRKFRMWEPTKKVETRHCIHIAELVSQRADHSGQRVENPTQRMDSSSHRADPLGHKMAHLTQKADHSVQSTHPRNHYDRKVDFSSHKVDHLRDPLSHKPAYPNKQSNYNRYNKK